MQETSAIPWSVWSPGTPEYPVELEGLSTYFFVLNQCGEQWSRGEIDDEEWNVRTISVFKQCKHLMSHHGGRWDDTLEEMQILNMLSDYFYKVWEFWSHKK